MNVKISIVIFAIFLYGITALNLLKPDDELSYSERRILRQAKEFTLTSFLDGSYSDEFDAYVTDQFVFRMPFRYLKTQMNTVFLGKSDENGIFEKYDHFFAMEYPYRPQNAVSLCNTLTKLINELSDEDEATVINPAHVFFSIIPDKSYYLDQSEHLSLDYHHLEQTMIDSLPGMNYIDLFTTLSLDDYYRTDSHWRQERLENVVTKLVISLDPDSASRQDSFTLSDYTANTFYPFYGVYYGQAASIGEGETLTYLTNEITGTIYDTDKLGKMDSYDIFLSGASALLTITNEACPTDKKLVLFRDSFGSSLAPLLLSEYKEITLVDLRYISSSLVKDYIDIAGKDVLFLYSTTVINNSSVITLK